MATQLVSRTAHGILVGGTADSVVLNASYGTVTVANRGEGDLFVTTDGTVPVVGGADTTLLPRQTISQIPVLAPVSPDGAAPSTTNVGLISTLPLPYSVSVYPLSNLTPLAASTGLGATQVQGIVDAALANANQASSSAAAQAAAIAAAADMLRVSY